MALSSFASEEAPRYAPSTRVSGPWHNFCPFAETLTPCCFSCSLRKISSRGFLKTSRRKSAPTLLKAPRHQILGKSDSPSFPSPARKAEGVFVDKATAPENPTFPSRELVSRGFLFDWFFTLLCVTTWLISYVPARNLSNAFVCSHFHLYFIQSNFNISVLNLYSWKYQFFAKFSPKQCLCFCTSSELEGELGGRCRCLWCS